MARSHRLQLLNPVDYEYYYGFPHFGEQERAYYFQLSQEESIFISGIKKAHIALYVHLQLGYFKAKQHLFSFTFSEVKADIRYLYRHYNNAYKWHLPFPSRNTVKRNRKRILDITGYIDEHGTQALIKKTTADGTPIKLP